MEEMERKFAELTEEQREKIPVIHKRYLVCMIAFAAAVLAVYFILFTGLNSRATELRAEAESYSVSDPDKSLELLSESQKASDTLLTVTIIVAVCGLVIIVVLMLLFKKKYPYYSDSIYFYLRSQEKAKRYH